MTHAMCANLCDLCATRPIFPSVFIRVHPRLILRHLPLRALRVLRVLRGSPLLPIFPKRCLSKRKTMINTEENTRSR